MSALVRVGFTIKTKSKKETCAQTKQQTHRIDIMKNKEEKKSLFIKFQFDSLFNITITNRKYIDFAILTI